MQFIRPSLVPSLLVLCAVSCGGSRPPAEAPASEARSTDDDYDPTANIGATAEIGALPEEETVHAFQGSFEPIQSCFIAGSKRLEFLSGEIAFNVVVGSDGSAKDVFAERSTLGHRETERCMFDALRKVRWPKPVGGPIGIAQNGFVFEMADDVRPPLQWDDLDVDALLTEHADAVAECKGQHRGRYTATVYVDTDGRAMSAGIAPPDKHAEAASDCLTNVLSEVTYPSPGSWPAKVTFSL